MSDDVYRVRSEACQALAKLSEIAATNEVMVALINATHDEDSDVRWNACESLGMLGEKAATKEVIAAMINETRDR
ncbi:unnamed protein product, partial [Rotaria magnacalcarata]